MHIRKYTSDLHQIICILPIAVARSSGGVGIRSVQYSALPALLMTSYLHIMCHMEVYLYHCDDWRHCVGVHRLTPLLRRIGCVVSWTTTGAETSRVR